MNSLERRRKRVRFGVSPLPKQSMLNEYDPRFANRQPTPFKPMRGPPFKKPRYDLDKPTTHMNNNLYPSFSKTHKIEKVEWRVLKVKNAIKIRETLSVSGKREINRINGNGDSCHKRRYTQLSKDHTVACRSSKYLYWKPVTSSDATTAGKSRFNRIKLTKRSNSQETPVHLQILMSQLKSRRLIPPDEPPKTSTFYTVSEVPSCMRRLTQSQKYYTLKANSNRSRNYLCHYYTHFQQGCINGDFCKKVHDEEIRKQCMARRPRKYIGSAYQFTQKQTKVKKSGVHYRKHSQSSRYDLPSLNRQINNNNLEGVQPEAIIKFSAPPSHNNFYSDTQLGYLNLEI
ncbi:hypothetical protein CAEBREN_26129 [Caenorhabditis brenneri]|uniref:C3H1-type domain-containing protein n=1 Tax=Caenorhabditis brenneri TaxID=135651 RepID=G0P4Q8_CAEBE|nr:hypothetical protein CAEBREN_26129 [Caenorhabditis brenneri]